MSPEMISKNGHDVLSDWWALGIVMYQLATGSLPFNNKDLEHLADSICFDDFPLKGYFSKDFSNLLNGLTQKIPSRRLGSKKGATEIKVHPFFKSINWDLVQ